MKITPPQPPLKPFKLPGDMTDCFHEADRTSPDCSGDNDVHWSEPDYLGPLRARLNDRMNFSWLAYRSRMTSAPDVANGEH